MSNTTFARIPLDAMALREGYLAGRRGLPGQANPYMVGTHEAIAWVIGLTDGRTKPLRIVAGTEWLSSG
jgi:hypothetical protein